MTVVRPFNPQPATRPGLLSRILGRRARENAVIEINNLLARSSGVRDVRFQQVEAICTAYGVDLYRDFTARVERLYRDYLNYCLADRHLSDDELAELHHLKKVLGLSEQATADIHDFVAKQVYCESVTEVLSDGRIDETERAFLRRLQENLELPDRLAHKIVDMKLSRLEDSPPTDPPARP